MGRETFPKGSDIQRVGVHFPTGLCRCGDSGPLHDIQVRYPELQPCPLLQSWAQWGGAKDQQCGMWGREEEQSLKIHT